MSRHEWHAIETFGGDTVRWVRGRCLHESPEPVLTVSGEHVANLCPDCDAQLPADLPAAL